jgi:hypothetical protein
VSPAGTRHGQVILRLTLRIAPFVDQHSLGHVFESSTGFRAAGRQRALAGRELEDVVPGFTLRLVELLK